MSWRDPRPWGMVSVLAAVLAPKVSALAVVDVVLILGLSLHWRELRSASLPRWVALAAAAWLVLSAVSGCAALLRHEPERPLDVVLVVARRAELLVALALGATVASRAGGHDAIRGALLLASVVVATYGVVTHVVPSWHPEARAGAVMARSFERGLYTGEASHMGALFAVALPLALALALTPGTPPSLRRLAAIALPMSLAGLLTTGTRTALAAAAVGAITVGCLRGWRTLAVAIGVLACAWSLMPPAFARRGAELASALSRPSLPSALRDRAHNWAEAAEGFAARPLLGVGPGARLVSVYDSEILMAMEGGGLGGAVTLAAFVLALWLALRAPGTAGEAGALAAMAVLAIGLVAFHLARVGLPFALLAGAACAGSRSRAITSG